MKNLKSIILLIIIVFITINVVRLFKEEHLVKYQIDKYSIEERFYMSKGHHYDLIIKDKNSTYIYTINEKLGKKKKIIKEIKTYKSNDLSCIIPIYKKDIKNDIYCDLGQQQVSLNYLYETNNSDFAKIYKKIEKYNIKLPVESKTKKNYKKLEVYQNNILKDHSYFIWDYKGIYIIDNQTIKYKKIIDSDLYDNVMNCIVDDYYVLFENSSVNGIEKIYYYDINKEKVESFILKNKLSKNSYINGVVDNLIYVTDRKSKKEYTIGIKDKIITEVDNDQTKYIVYENYVKKELSKSDYFMKDNIFNNVLISDKEVTISKELKKEYNYYYFIEDDKLYKALDTNKKDKILLAEVDNVVDWLIKDGEVLLLKEGTIYSYTEEKGLKKILATNELKYNYKNIYDLWNK